MNTTVETAPISLEELLELNRIDLFPEESEEKNTVVITRHIVTIRALEKQIERYDAQSREADAFYEQRAAACEERIAFLKRSILAFLDQNGLKNIQTPAGTAFKKNLTLRIFPDDDALVSWAEANVPNGIRTKKEPNKKVINEHIAATGNSPDGYTEVNETRLYIR